MTERTAREIIADRMSYAREHMERGPERTLLPAHGMLDRFASVRHRAAHIREVTRLGRAPYERVITVATRDMLGPWDQVLTHVAVVNGAAK